ncbi:hypothetical protein JCM11641_007154 [Rhodosporidiobolus odoratus]
MEPRQETTDPVTKRRTSTCTPAEQYFVERHLTAPFFTFDLSSPLDGPFNPSTTSVGKDGLFWTINEVLFDYRIGEHSIPVHTWHECNNLCALFKGKGKACEKVGPEEDIPVTDM